MAKRGHFYRVTLVVGVTHSGGLIQLLSGMERGPRDPETRRCDHSARTYTRCVDGDHERVEATTVSVDVTGGPPP